MIMIIALYLIANLFWFLLFSPLARISLNFWMAMTAAVGLLSAAALIAQRGKLKQVFELRSSYVFIGIISAGILYCLFVLGRQLSSALLPFSQSQIIRIYAIKSSAPSWLIGILLVAWIGPAEEIFWRGFLQQRLSGLFGDKAGYIASSLMYAFIHLYALNFMLFAAALVCGLFWGFLFKKYHSLWPVIISHSLWDIFVFIIAPL